MQDQTKPKPQLYSALSSERLEAYRRRLGVGDDDSALFGCYLWNVTLSESLYPGLQALEVVLRNSIHAAATEHFRGLDWFDKPGVLQHERERESIAAARSGLLKQGKSDDTASVIAELSFGFWASLLDRRYEQVLWPRLLRAVFPFVPRRSRTRQELSRRIQALRVLRNRVFHYEPIWHWRDLKNQHSQLVEAIGWVAPAAATLLAVVDRFPDVHARGQGSWDKAVSAVLNGDIGC